MFNSLLCRPCSIHSRSFVKTLSERYAHLPLLTLPSRSSNSPGRAQLYHAGRVRSYPELIRASAGHSLRVSGADNDLVLQQDGLLHGTRTLRGNFL